MSRVRRCGGRARLERVPDDPKQTVLNLTPPTGSGQQRMRAARKAVYAYNDGERLGADGGLATTSGRMSDGRCRRRCNLQKIRSGSG
jgi:hypothetical protein